MDPLLQMLMSGRPQQYVGTQTLDQVNADATRAQQWALAQQNLDANNYQAKLGLQGKLAELQTQEKMPGINFEYQNQLQNAQLQNAMEQAKLASDTQRYATDAQKYGYDSQLQAALAGYQNQANIASQNNALGRYQTDVNAQTQLGNTNLQGQYALQQTLIPQQFKQERFDAIMPLLSGVLNQYTGGSPSAAGAGTAGMGMGTAGGVQAARSQSFPKTGDFFLDQYNQAIAEGRLAPGTPAPYSPNGFWTDQYLQNYLSNPNAKYGGGGIGEPSPTAMTDTEAPDWFLAQGFNASDFGKPTEPIQSGYPGGSPQGQNQTAYGPTNAYGTNLTGGVQSGTNSLSSAAPGSPADEFSKATNNQIGMGPVISGQQQNQMLNSALAGNAQSAAGAMQNAQTSFGSRGWAPTSPALRSYQNRIGMNQMLADTQARTQIPMQAAQTNANYALQAQQGNLAAQNQRLGALSSYYNSQSNMMSPILSALVSMGS